jgi:predicted nucleic acid-binding protein
MPASPFFDTNVLIYSIAENDRRSDVAESLLAAGGVVSVQVLNEFVATARRKLEMSWDEIVEALGAIRVLCPSPVAIAFETHDSAIRIAQTYNFHIYDALVVASALEAGCDTLYTEDLQDGQLIDDRLTVRNPFKLQEAPTTSS